MMPWKAIYEGVEPGPATAPYDFKPGRLPPDAYSYHSYMRMGLSKSEAKRAVKNVKEERILLSSGYQVNVIELGNEHDQWRNLTWLSIKRRDKRPILDRQVLRELKEVLGGPDSEGYELYPAESRLVDTANQYHLYLTQGPTPQAFAAKQPVDVRALDRELAGLKAVTQEVGEGLTTLKLVDSEGIEVGDWRLRQLAKNQLFGAECEGVEIFPSNLRQDSPLVENRIVVLTRPGLRFPFGFRQRSVAAPADELVLKSGAIQREFGT